MYSVIEESNNILLLGMRFFIEGEGKMMRKNLVLNLITGFSMSPPCLKRVRFHLPTETP